jgi:hypothetical protein
VITAPGHLTSDEPDAAGGQAALEPLAAPAAADETSDEAVHPVW